MTTKERKLNNYVFEVILMLASQRADEQLKKLFRSDDNVRNNEEDKKQRGNTPTTLEYIIFCYVLGKKFLKSFIRRNYIYGY